MSERTIRTHVERGVDEYLALIHFFCSKRDRCRIHIRFEDLLSADPEIRSASAASLLSAIGAETQSQPAADLEKLLSLSKDSQKSLGGDLDARLERRIRKHLSAMIDYDAVLLDIRQSLLSPN